MQSKPMQGHLSAWFTILIWGATFIATKLLLQNFRPLEILFYRFAVGFVVLLLLRPRRLRVTERRRELLFAGAGLSGITLYYLMENIALTYTTATNVGVIISMAPFFTAVLARIFLRTERPGPLFYVGFAVAIAGIGLISYNGSTALGLNPIGDLLALLAAAVWAAYSIFTRKIGVLGYDTILATRRIFAYGIAFMIPAALFLEFRLGLERLVVPGNVLSILFLGVLASAICFVTWNFSVNVLGAVKTSVYIYLVPVITLTISALVLREPITATSLVGIGLTLAGLFLSEAKLHARSRSGRA